MNAHTLKSALFLLPFWAGMTYAAAPANVPDPAAPVALLQTALVEATKQTKVDARQAALRTAINNSFDLSAAGRLILRSAWRDLSADQQAKFANALGHLVAANFASRFRPGAVVSFSGAQVSDLPRGRASVRTRLARAAGEPVPFDYTLQQSGEQWRIVNLLVAGVSDIALRSAQYTRQLEADGLDAVLASMQDEADATLLAAQ